MQHFKHPIKSIFKKKYYFLLSLSFARSSLSCTHTFPQIFTDVQVRGLWWPFQKLHFVSLSVYGDCLRLVWVHCHVMVSFSLV